MKFHNRLGFHKFLNASNLNDKDKYEDYAKRIQKTLYYGRLPSTDRPSLPVTGLLVDKFGKFCKRDGFDQLNLHEASSICYDACVTPCSVIVALLYLDRLRTQNPEYLASTSPSKVFIVALMVASKYLYDDGEEDEVFNDEWATSAAMMLSDLNEAEKNFLSAIDWNLFVDVKLFMNGLLYLESAVAREQGTTRGFFVYSDLVTLSKCLPPVWSCLLSLVGSVIVICLVGYTVSVCVVVAGTIASKACAVYVASQLVRLSLLPHPPPPPPLLCPLAVPGCQTDHDHSANNSSLTEQEILSSLEKSFEDGQEEEEKDPVVTPPSFSSKFTALRTLTAALLLASSSKFGDASKELSPFSTALDHTLGCCNTLFDSFANAETMQKNQYPLDAPFCNHCEDAANARSLPRSRKGARKGWRKANAERNVSARGTEPEMFLPRDVAYMEPRVSMFESEPRQYHFAVHAHGTPGGFPAMWTSSFPDFPPNVSTSFAASAPSSPSFSIPLGDPDWGGRGSFPDWGDAASIIPGWLWDSLPLVRPFRAAPPFRLFSDYVQRVDWKYNLIMLT